MSRATLAPILRKTTPLLKFTLFDSLDPLPTDFTPAPLDLTGAAVTLSAKIAPESTATQFSKACTLDALPATGRCSIRLTTSDTDATGVLYCELKVAWSSGARNGQVLGAGSFQMLLAEALA